MNSTLLETLVSEFARNQCEDWDQVTLETVLERAYSIGVSVGEANMAAEAQDRADFEAENARYDAIDRRHNA